MIGAALTQAGGRGVDQFYAAINPPSQEQGWTNGGLTFYFKATPFNYVDINLVEYLWTCDNPLVTPTNPSANLCSFSTSGFNETIDGIVTCVVTDTSAATTSAPTATFSYKFS